MGSVRRLQAVLLTLALLVTLAGGAAAEKGKKEGKKIGLTLTVSHVSPRPGPIDPGAASLHQRLRQEFRYESLRVLKRKQLQLRLDEVGSVKLPTGRWVRVRPLHVGSSGVLMAVEVEGTLQTDLRVANHHQVHIGAEAYQGGKLVVTLEPDY